MELSKEQLHDLVGSGEIELDNGDVLRFTELPDEDTRVGDFDCYGKVEHIWRRTYRPERPDGFDGMAEKIHTGRDEFWWQPPDDLRSGWHSYEHRNHLRNLVRDILSYGFVVYRVELCRGRDAYGQAIVVDYATIGGIEPFQTDDDKVGFLSDLVCDIVDDKSRELV